MKALVFDGKLRMADLPEPVPAKGEALIRVRMAGICNTDIEIVKGYMAFSGVPGHEFVGEVEAADEKWIGKRVVGEINAACGVCEWCRAGKERHCPGREVLGIFRRNGAFAEKLCLPVKNLHVVPDSVPDDVAVFTEPVAACFEILGQVEIMPGDKVAVIGDGKLGLLAAQVLKGATENLTVIGKHMAGARRRLAPTGNRQSNIRAIKENELGDELFDIVVECSGHPSGLALATRIVKPLGTIVLKSTYHEKPQIDTSLWVVNEIKIIGSRCGPFAPALKALESGAVAPLPLIGEIFPFARAIDAFSAAQKPGAMKMLMRFD